jgi:spermidine/putrescine transport system permease protein
MKKSRVALVITILVLVFLYLPIVVLMVNSFNSSKTGSVWKGFSLVWYEKLFSDKAIWKAVQNTAVVALVSTAVSVILGTTAGFALYKYKTAFQKMHSALVSLPLVIPDILMGMSLIIFFISLKIPLGIFTIILGHVTFCISYVATSVLTRFQDFDNSVIEAAQDLGARWHHLVFQIYLPLLAPGIVAGAMLALSLSMDDFIITFFTAGPGSTTLPIQIYSMIRFGNPPVINALTTIFLMLAFLVALINQRLSRSIK